MARPSTINAEQILTAAREVFLELGYQEATTARIAERAGISEGSIFNHFKDKPTLFSRAMQIRPPVVLDSLPALVGKGDLRENLERLTREWLDFIEELVPKIMMMWSHRASATGGATPRMGPPLEVVRALAAFFEAEMDLGRMRRTDTEILARMFLGSLWSYVMIRLTGQGLLPMSRDTYVRGVIDQLWHGAKPGKLSKANK